MPKQPPICGKCQRSHWNFVECEKVQEHRHAAAEKRKVQVFVKPPEGMRMWGDRFSTVERRGENTFLQRTPPPRKNQLIYPKAG